VPVPASPSLADSLKQGRDNFLLLRLLAASMVVFGHSYAIAQIPGLHDFIAMSGWGPGVYTGSIAVDIFFVVSGFLVTGSYVNRRDLRQFLRSRFLRIVPAYLACVVITALVVGTLVSELSTTQYLGHVDTLRYIIKNLTFTNLEWYLPGVFESNPHPRVVNGSLWTLPAEVRMYAWVAIFGLAGLLHRRWLFNVIIGLAFILAAWFPDQATSLFRVDSYFRLAGLFALGAVFYLNREFIPLNGLIAAALVLLCYWLHGTAHFMSVFAVALAYVSLWLAYAPRIPGFEKIGDYSYGVYLWGFPVQQTVAWVIGSPTPMQVFAWAMPITLLIAVASWHWLEKPALRLKHLPMHRWPMALLRRAPEPPAAATAAT
jgi:peptidoglycan/LPS O-acetylase OafA/YrhL